MEVIAFLIVGLLAGWIASFLVTGKGAGLFPDIIVGVVGAFIGGYVFRYFDVTAYGFFGSLGMSVVGAVLFLLVIGVFYKRRYITKPKL